MRKIFLMASMLIFSVFAYGAPTRYTSLGIGTEAQCDAATNSIGDGDEYINGDLEVDGDVYMSDIFAFKDHWENLPAKDSDTVAGITVTTATLTSPTSSWALTVHTMPGAPRNLVVSVVGGGDLPGGDGVVCTSHTFTLTGTISGKDARGNSISEVIVSTCGINSFVGNHAFVGSITSNWALTSPCADIGAISSLKINVGTGDKIGLMGDIDSSIDVYSVKEGYVNKATSTYTISATYDTWTPTNVPNGSIDYDIYYRPITE